MGNINLTFADNYGFGPVEAAENYQDRNKTSSFQLPKVTSWKLITGTDLYEKGFGVVGQLAKSDPAADDEFIGFKVCFLFNQTSGVQNALTKSISVQTAAGEITQRMEKIAADISLQRDAANAEMVGQLYIDAALQALSKMNEINQSGDTWDFNYQFNLSDLQIWGNSGSSKYPIQFDDPNYANYTKGTRLPIGEAAASVSYERTVDGEVLSLPGWYGNDTIWNQGSATTFYSGGLTPKADSENEVRDEIVQDINECFDKQKDQVTELLEKIKGKSEQGG